MSLPVHFYPELHLQRRLVILDLLRKHAISAILDIGCGQGELLAVLARPAPWLSPPSENTLSTAVVETLAPDGDKSAVESLVRHHLECKEDVLSLHPTVVCGLDLNASDLAFAISGTAPPPVTSDLLHQHHSRTQRAFSLTEIRWETLKTQIWHGDLRVVNPDFIDIECIVSSEVIEHLPQDVFPNFAPIVLAVYHPQFFVVTTPSYTFNARWTPPDDTSSREGYTDPTGRTNRVFRHPDHKFEMTVGEFKEWCQVSAAEYGYEVKVSAIGRPVEEDPYGRDEELGGASQVAEFKRLDDQASIGKRERASQDYIQRMANKDPHELLVDVDHLSHPESQRPRPLEEIGKLVIAHMEESREAFKRFEELWFLDDEIQIACGGWVEMLGLAIETHNRLTLATENSEKRSVWQVQLIGAVPEPFWSEEGEKSVDHIPEDWIPDDNETQEEIFQDGLWCSTPEEGQDSMEIWQESSWDESAAGRWGVPDNPWTEEPESMQSVDDGSWIERSGFDEEQSIEADNQTIDDESIVEDVEAAESVDSGRLGSHTSEGQEDEEDKVSQQSP